MNLSLEILPGVWRHVPRSHPAARALADRHYSRQTHGAAEFTPPGRVFVMLTEDEKAVWAACENLDGAGATQFRVTIFRNESTLRSSELIKAATALTLERWHRRWGGAQAPLRTEIDVSKVRHKRDPGRCFLRAGWRRVGVTSKGLVLLEAAA